MNKIEKAFEAKYAYTSAKEKLKGIDVGNIVEIGDDDSVKRSLHSAATTLGIKIMYRTIDGVIYVKRVG